MASVRITAGPRTGIDVPLDKPKVVFGRHSSCDCVLDHGTVSRTHFAIERVGKSFLLVDQESGNGTEVNGMRVTWTGLKNGDRIQAGPFVLVVDLPSARAADEMQSTDESQEESDSDSDRHYRRLYPSEYVEGIHHFNARRYFEAHEVWEEIWLRSHGDRKVFYQMLIQAAVGLHHYERGNARGGRGMHKAVNEKLGRLPAVFMSLDLVDFSSQFNGFFRELVEDKDSDAMRPPDKPRPQIRLLPGESAC